MSSFRLIFFLYLSFSKEIVTEQMMCFTLEIHGWIYHINPRQRLEKKKIKKKENKKRKPPLE